MNAIKLHEIKHPDRKCIAVYESLVGIDAQKEDLIQFLLSVLDRDRIGRWEAKHYPKGLALADALKQRSPFVILAGEVGCGKTALATSVGSAIAAATNARVVSVETPSDIRGGGMVGELSSRVTSAFAEAQSVVGKNLGILIIDEGDDVGTSRSQMQAHHEDRAGLNVLIKEIDGLARHDARIAVLLITNRLAALDPALIRRAHVVTFHRPDEQARRALFMHLLKGIAHSARDVDELVEVSAKEPAFSFSDIVHRGMDIVVRSAIQHDQPISVPRLKAVLAALVPTPLVEP